MNDIAEKGENSGIVIVEDHNNTSQKLIRITEDKLRLRQIEYIGKCATNQSWHMPLGLVVTIVLVFCTAEFKLAFGLSADTWRAIFVVSGVVCCGWLLFALFKLRKAPTLDELIESIKAEK